MYGRCFIESYPLPSFARLAAGMLLQFIKQPPDGSSETVAINIAICYKFNLDFTAEKSKRFENEVQVCSEFIFLPFCKTASPDSLLLQSFGLRSLP